MVYKRNTQPGHSFLRTTFNLEVRLVSLPDGHVAAYSWMDHLSVTAHPDTASCEVRRFTSDNLGYPGPQKFHRRSRFDFEGLTSGGNQPGFAFTKAPACDVSSATQEDHDVKTLWLRLV